MIRATGTEPVVIEYLKTPPSRAELRELVGRMGVPLRDVLRRKGTPYDELGLDNPALTDEALLDAVERHPLPINRLIVVASKRVRLCRPSEAVLDLLDRPLPASFAKEDGERVALLSSRPEPPAGAAVMEADAIRPGGSLGSLDIRVSPLAPHDVLPCARP